MTSRNFAQKQNNTNGEYNLELQKNDIVELEVLSTGINGEGVSKVDGKTVFIRGAIQGELVRAKIILVKKSFDIAILDKILRPSAHRVTAPCPLFGKCGGCDLQHLSYDAQLRIKRQTLSDTLLHVGKIEAPVDEVVASTPLRYRNKLSLPVRSAGGEIKIGLFARGSHRVIPCEDCLLQHEWNAPLISALKEFMTENSISAYDEESGCGTIRHLVARMAAGILTVTVVATQDLNVEPLFEKLTRLFPSVRLFVNENKSKNNVILGEKWHFRGEKIHPEQIDGLSVDIHPGSFFQVNDEIRELLYADIAKTVHGSVAIEAYSGAGLLSARLAQNATAVYGIEINKQAHESAMEIKRRNSLDNFSPIQGDVGKELAPLLNRIGDKNPFLVIDPPRSGLGEQAIACILSALPQNIVYVSCNPATLARDLSLLRSHYDVDRITPYDMFPQTMNVETLVVLSRKR